MRYSKIVNETAIHQSSNELDVMTLKILYSNDLFYFVVIEIVLSLCFYFHFRQVVRA